MRFCKIDFIPTSFIWNYLRKMRGIFFFIGLAVIINAARFVFSYTCIQVNPTVFLPIECWMGEGYSDFGDNIMLMTLALYGPPRPLVAPPRLLYFSILQPNVRLFAICCNIFQYSNQIWDKIWNILKFGCCIGKYCNKKLQKGEHLVAILKIQQPRGATKGLGRAI